MRDFDRHRDLPHEINSAIRCPKYGRNLQYSRWRSSLEFEYASSILDELSNCSLISSDSMTICVSFDPNVGPGYETEIRLLANVLDLKLCPLGVVGGSSGFLLVSETQHFLMLGSHAPGVLYIGHGLGESLQRLTKPDLVLPWLVVSRELDPEGVFVPCNGPLEKGTKVIYVRTSEGFVPIVTQI